MTDEELGHFYQHLYAHRLGLNLVIQKLILMMNCHLSNEQLLPVMLEIVKKIIQFKHSAIKGIQ